MGQVETDIPMAEISEDHRRAARIRRVRPVAFALNGDGNQAARRTVTANISRGGMLLVSRKDKFPPAGSSLRIMPYDPDADTSQSGTVSIPGRIVYTRFSPRTELRFAGLKFETDLSDTDAHSIGLDGAPDAVARTLQALERIEALADSGEVTLIASPTAPSRRSVDNEIRILAQRMEDACAEFLRATVRFYIEWGEARLRDTIAQRHVLARAKGVAGLRALKDEWRSLMDGMPALVDAQLSRDSLWPHRAIAGAQSPIDAGATWFYDIERDQPPPHLIEEMRKLAGFIGRLIVRHGFEDVGPDSDWVPIAHERALVAFRGRFVISDDMRNTLCGAARMQDELRTLLDRAAHAQEAEAQTQALHLWESA